MLDVLDRMYDDGLGSVSSCSRAARVLLSMLGPRKVLEIGTSYGRQLGSYSAASSLICVDPMYDWVPDVREEEGFDPSKVDQEKVETWWANAHSAGVIDRAELVVESSYRVHSDPRYSDLFHDTELLIIDGCHHPAELVFKDFSNFRRFLTDPCYVVWDDYDMPDVRQAVDLARSSLTDRRVSCREFHGCLIMFVSPP